MARNLDNVYAAGCREVHQAGVVANIEPTVAQQRCGLPERETDGINHSSVQTDTQRRCKMLLAGPPHDDMPRAP